MSRCIVVLGPHRGGTSCTAGVLHHLGATVHTGPGSRNRNLAGHWEDGGFVGLHNRMIGGAWMLPDKVTEVPAGMERAYCETAARRDAEHEAWTLKDPRLCAVIGAVIRLLPSPKVVMVWRDPEHVAASLMARGNGPPDKAQASAETHQRYMREFLETWDGPGLGLWYDELVDETEWTVRRLAGLMPDDVPEDDIQTAIDFVDPSLRHHA